MRPVSSSFRGLSFLLSIAAAVVASSDEASGVVVPLWRGETVQDLHREYNNVFRHGNRNAASHRWATFLIDRASQMAPSKLEYMFSGFCAVSGSPVRPSDYGRYLLRLESAVAHAPAEKGFMYYCCWPCVCDTQDFIRADTKTITTKTETRVAHFAVIGNPCAYPEKLDEPFVQPFDGRSTTLRRDAAEVRCGADGSLEGATLSDHGHVIIGLFFDAPDDAVDAADAQPGRVRQLGAYSFQDEADFAPSCGDRAAHGYNSGMGEIFRQVHAHTCISDSGMGEKVHAYAHAHRGMGEFF